WTITVSADGYVDSTYTLNIVKGWNDEQVITLESSAYGSFTDDRDDQVYSWVRIGTQVWMAENLNYAASGSWCYDDDSANCDLYGRLYDWSTVMGFDASCNTTSCASQVQSFHRGICPDGWHVPSDAEWTTLVNFVGDSSTAGTRLRALTGWEPLSATLIPGTDDHGFSALPGGRRSTTDGGFWNVGARGLWWSATEDGAAFAWNRRMYSGYSSVYRNSWGKRNGLSLRCVR
ncbi:MAG: fibrobacter succinogenes major paralogous domain-containing protein, partial [Chitinispirillales bacterium]|nr:fibrobacter succinogenes major paralogous domain-containing protein [Chitinispirillales bacterium]